jgi:hypothetical protein
VSNLILHHYDFSNYSKKVRVALVTNRWSGRARDCPTSGAEASFGRLTDC